MSCPNEYTCAACGGTFHTDWTDEEAREEFIQNFGRLPTEEDDIKICDHCYKKYEHTIRSAGIVN